MIRTHNALHIRAQQKKLVLVRLEEMDGPAECSEIISFEHQNKSKTKYNFNLGVALHLKLIFNICRGQ